MKPFFTDAQLNSMSRENMIEVMKVMQAQVEKKEDLSSFEITETIEYKLTGKDRYCPDSGIKYKVVTKETVKRLKFIPSTFEVVEEVTYVYSCPKCGTMVRPDKISPLIKGSVATSSLVAGIMHSAATRLFLSWDRQAVTMASEIWSQILSGCPHETCSLVKIIKKSSFRMYGCVKG